MKTQLDLAQEVIDRLEASLDGMRAKLAQEKADVGKLSWPAIGSLSYIAEQLDSLEAFWGSGIPNA